MGQTTKCTICDNYFVNGDEVEVEESGSLHHLRCAAEAA